MNTEKKSFGLALLCWFLGGFWLGLHRVYIKESPLTLFWYWAASLCTFGLLPLIDLFLIKGMIETKHMTDYTKREMIKNNL